MLIIILFALFTLGIQQLTMSYKEIAENGYIMISISSLAVGAIMYKYIMSKISSDLPTNEEEKEETITNSANKAEKVKKIIVCVFCFIPIFLFHMYTLLYYINKRMTILIKLITQYQHSFGKYIHHIFAITQLKQLYYNIPCFKF